MQISATMTKALLSYVTTGYFDDHGEPPDTVEDIAELVRNMRAVAERSGDLPWLKLALGYLLTDGAARQGEFVGRAATLDADQAADLLGLIWAALFPAEAPPFAGEGAPIELVPMDADAWRDHRKAISGA